jgi:hypothetical protein
VFGLSSLRITCMALLTTVLVAASEPSCAVMAQGAGQGLAQGAECSEACKAAYGDCYKTHHNRGICEAQLQRCLQGCIASKRG